MSVSIDLPRYVSTREMADALLAEQHVPDALDDERVVLIAKHLVSATGSFIEQLLSRLEDRGAREVVVFGAPAILRSHVNLLTTRNQWANVRLATDADLAAL